MRSVRLKTGMSQNEVSDKLHFPQSFMSKVERGERQLQVLEFVLICQVLGIDPTIALAGYLSGLPELPPLGSAKRVLRGTILHPEK